MTHFCIRFSQPLALLAICLSVTATFCQTATSSQVEKFREHGFADSGEVKISYLTTRESPIAAMTHRLPDFWYTWRNQIPQLAKNFEVVAINQQGHNQSGPPTGIDNYTADKLAGDVQHHGADKANIAGHNCGGMVACMFAMTHSEMTERLGMLNLPQPTGMTRELMYNSVQQAASASPHFCRQQHASCKVTPTIDQWLRQDEMK